MDFFKCFIKNYWSYLLNGILLMVLISTTSYFLLNETEVVENSNLELSYDVQDKEVIDDIYVDVKGAVKKPGVYEMDSSSIINDVITKAGGFTSKAYKNNINLSKKISDEMVIYVYTKTEYKNINDTKKAETPICNCDTYYIDSCTDKASSVITSNNETTSNSVTSEPEKNTVESIEQELENDSKVSLNKATKEELMKLNGIGESKAENIIKYREENGGFKTIEDIKNVSGIGEAAYEKIKDYITI